MDGTAIESVDWNSVLADLAAALTQSVSKDGQTLMTGALDMNTHKIKNVTDGTAATDAATVGQVAAAAYQFATVGGTADAITLTPSPAITSYVAGQEFWGIASGTNTGAVTIAVSGLTAKAGQLDSAAMVAGQIVSGRLMGWKYDGTAFQFINPATPLAATTTETITGTNAAKFVTPDSLAALWENNSTDVTDGAAITIGEGGSFNLITSTTAITSFVFTTSKAGRKVLVRFNTARTLTHNATTLFIVPGGASITTAAGDVCEVEDRGSGNVRVNWYVKVDGTAVVRAVGQPVQVVNTQTGSMTTGATTIPYDDTIPQITEGNEFMTLAITPTNASNKLRIDVVFNGSVANATNRIIVALFQDSTANALAVSMTELSATTMVGNVKFTHYMTAGTTSATTFRVRAGSSVGTITFNGSGGASLFNGTLASSITITEIKV